MNGLAGCHQIHRLVFVGQGLTESNSKSTVVANQYSEGVCLQIKAKTTTLCILTGIQRCQRFLFERSQFELGWRRGLRHGEKRGSKFWCFAQYRNQHRRPISATKKRRRRTQCYFHTKWAFDCNNNTFMWSYIFCTILYCKRRVAGKATQFHSSGKSHVYKMTPQNYKWKLPFPELFQRFLLLMTKEALV